MQPNSRMVKHAKRSGKLVPWAMVRAKAYKNQRSSSPDFDVSSTWPVCLASFNTDHRTWPSQCEALAQRPWRGGGFMSRTQLGVWQVRAAIRAFFAQVYGGAWCV